LYAVHTINGGVSIVDCIRFHSTPNTLVAIDAPLIITNTTGQRTCETEVGKRYGVRNASCHSSNLTLHPNSAGAALMNQLLKNGFAHFDVKDPEQSGKLMAEVYPHAAMVALWDLPKALSYKKGSVAQRRVGLGTLRRQLRGLEQADPSLDSSDVLTELLSRNLDELTGRQLKDYEDQLDAVFCAYLAYYFWYWRDEKSEVFGDTANGYILNPKLQSRMDSRKS
jgi:predicted RNase H-like nuclease